MPYRQPNTTPGRWLGHAAANVVSEALAAHFRRHPDLIGTDEFHKKWMAAKETVQKIRELIDTLPYMKIPLTPPSPAETPPGLPDKPPEPTS
jgi:hypothetical protein